MLGRADIRMRPGQCVCWYLASNSHPSTVDFPSRRNCSHCLLYCCLLKQMVVGGRHQDFAALSSARISAGPRAEAVSWKLLRLETALAVVLMRKAVWSAYTRSLKCSRLTSTPGFVFHMPQHPVDGDTEEGWCQETALPYAWRRQ